MMYYIIGERNVIGESPCIASARKAVAKMIAFDMHVFGHSCGYHICTKSAEREYHGISTDNCTYIQRTAPGAKFRAEYKSAIAEYEAEQARRREILNDVNAERVPFETP